MVELEIGMVELETGTGMVELEIGMVELETGTGMVELEIGDLETGAELVMVTDNESYDVAIPSETVSVRITVLVELTWGAVKVVERAVGLARVMGRLESCDHRYVSGLSSGSEAVPFR